MLVVDPTICRRYRFQLIPLILYVYLFLLYFFYFFFRIFAYNYRVLRMILLDICAITLLIDACRVISC